MDLNSCDLGLLNKLMMHHRWWNLIQNIHTCPTYGQCLLMEQWTFLYTCEHLAHRPDTALSIWLQPTPPSLSVWHHAPSLTWHPLIARLPTFSSPPTSVMGSAMLHPPHHPLLSHWDWAWQADNAHFLAPNIGERRIKRTNLSLFPSQSSPVFRRSSWTSASL